LRSLSLFYFTRRSPPFTLIVFRFVRTPFVWFYALHLSPETWTAIFECSTNLVRSHSWILVINLFSCWRRLLLLLHYLHLVKNLVKILLKFNLVSWVNSRSRRLWSKWLICLQFFLDILLYFLYLSCNQFYIIILK
jgi:hypothetical protein